MNNSNEIPTIEELNSEEVERLIPTITYLGLLIITGTVGNVIVVYVYTTKYGPSNTKYFILCLSVIDLFTCCVVLPMEIAIMTTQYNFRHVWLCKASRFGNSISTLSSAALLIVIATDRYRRMCQPFRWQIARKYAKLLCAGCIFAGLVLSWPAFFIYGRKTVHIQPFNITGTDCTVDEDISKTLIPLANNIALIGAFLIGMVFICIIYCCIGCAIYRHAKRMPKDFRATTKRRLTQKSSVSTVCEMEMSVDGHPNGTIGNVVSQLEAQTVPSKTHFDGHCPVSESKDDGTKRSIPNGSPKSNGKPVAISREDIIHSKAVENGNCVIGQKSHANGSCSPETCRDIASSRESVRSHSIRDRTYSNEEYSHQSTNVRKTSVLMLIISVTFIVSYLPHLLLMLIREIDDTFVDNMSDSARATYKFFLRSYFLNCATNPVIYCIYGSHFRASCKQLFLSCFRRSDNTHKVFMSINHAQSWKQSKRNNSEKAN